MVRGGVQVSAESQSVGSQIEPGRVSPSRVQDEAMSAHEYCDDDTGYLDWLDKNPHGYVINIQRSHSPIDARLHDASCSALIAKAFYARITTSVIRVDRFLWTTTCSTTKFR